MSLIPITNILYITLIIKILLISIGPCVKVKKMIKYITYEVNKTTFDTFYIGKGLVW